LSKSQAEPRQKILPEPEYPRNQTEHSLRAAKRKLAHAAFLYAILYRVYYPISVSCPRRREIAPRPVGLKVHQ